MIIITAGSQVRQETIAQVAAAVAISDQPTYRLEVADLTGLSPPVVGQIIKLLAQNGYVENGSETRLRRPSTRGNGKAVPVTATDKLRQEVASNPLWNQAFLRLLLGRELGLSASQVDHQALRVLAREHGIVAKP